MNKVKIDGTKVSYIRTGKKNKPKLVFFHPLFGSLKYYEESIKYLIDDFHIVALDFPGFGLSEKYKEKEHNLENYSKTANKLCNYLKFRKFHLVGSSLGAMASIQFTHMFPKKVEKLVLHAPPLDNTSYDFSLREKLMDYASQSDYIVEKADKLFKQSKKKLSRKGLDKIMKYMERHYPDFDDEYGVIYHCFKTLDLSAAVDVWRSIRQIDLSKEAEGIEKKTLIFYGGNDESVRLHSMKALSKMIEDSELEVIKGGIHAIFLQHPTKIALLVKDFLQND